MSLRKSRTCTPALPAAERLQRLGIHMAKAPSGAEPSDAHQPLAWLVPHLFSGRGGFAVPAFWLRGGRRDRSKAGMCPEMSMIGGLPLH